MDLATTTRLVVENVERVMVGKHDTEVMTGAWSTGAAVGDGLAVGDGARGKQREPHTAPTPGIIDTMSSTGATNEATDLMTFRAPLMVFLLLIFFVVTTSFVKESGIDVSRASAATAVPGSGRTAPAGWIS